jgi:hypothetical protein
MQYWKSPKIGRMERLEDDVFKKHPEKLDELKSHGFIRVQGEHSDMPYIKPVKKRSIKKAVKKAAKKMIKK